MKQSFSEITCPPFVVKEGTYLAAIISGTEIGDTVLLTCVEGYITKSKTELVCSKNGEWNGDVPVCKGMRVPLLLLIII